jgi:tripartite motif-containing protein 2/3/tripartite motif-containing protein 71
VFSPSGEKLRSFGTPGSGPGQLKYPREVALGGEGDILVVDSWNHRIQSFTPDGQHSVSEVSGELQFSLPTGIAFNASNNKVYVTDANKHRVQVLNSDLTFSSTFGKKGNGKGQFYRPWGIACDRTGKVYVADILVSKSSRPRGSS